MIICTNIDIYSKISEITGTMFSQKNITYAQVNLINMIK